MKALEVCELPRLRRLVPPACFCNSFKHLHLQLFLDSDRNHVVICYLIQRHQSGHSPLPSRRCAARAFSFTSFTSFTSLTSSKPFRIRTSKTPLAQLLYNPHLRAPLGSAGNKGLITPLESALTKNSPVSLLESALAERWGWGPCFPLRNAPLTARHSQPDSSSLFSHSSKLFCTRQKLNSFVFMQFRTLCQKHPGVGAGDVLLASPRRTASVAHAFWGEAS